MNKYTPWNNRGCKYPSTMEKSDSKIKTWEDLDEGEGKKRAERIGRRNYRSTRRYTISDSRKRASWSRRGGSVVEVGEVRTPRADRFTIASSLFEKGIVSLVKRGTGDKLASSRYPTSFEFVRRALFYVFPRGRMCVCLSGRIERNFAVQIRST